MLSPLFFFFEGQLLINSRLDVLMAFFIARQIDFFITPLAIYKQDGIKLHYDKWIEENESSSKNGTFPMRAGGNS